MKNKIMVLLATIAICTICQTADASTAFNTNLYYGLTNNSDVSTLQTILISKGLLSGSATGNFFNLTKQAVIAFQLQNSISPTGYVGPLTRNALNKLSVSVTVNTNTNVAITPPVHQVQVTPQVQTTTVVNYSSYPTLAVTDYNKNPAQYLSKGIEIQNAFVSDFLPAGDRGGSNSYIEITNYALSQDKMMLRTYNADDYSKLSAILNKGDFLNIYGIGSPSEAFTSHNAYTSFSTQEPVILVQRVDKCSSSDCSTSGISTIFDRTGTVSLSVSSSANTTTSSGGSNATQQLLQTRLNWSLTQLTTTGLSDELNNSYNVPTINYFNAQMQANPGNIQTAKGYLSILVTYYKNLSNAVSSMVTVASGVNSNIASYSSSPDLTATQRQVISDLNTYSMQRLADWTAKLTTINNTLATYQNTLNGSGTMSASDLATAAANLSTLQSYFVGEEATFSSKLQVTVGSF